MLREEDYQRAANELHVEPACIKAVTEVETGGKGGFIDTGEPKILFEAHVFSRLTNHIYDNSHPKISSTTWNKSLYVGGKAEHIRLQEAAKLDRNAALQSASWGLFQIMGANWKACGCESLQDFINKSYRSEADQLDLFVGCLRTQQLDRFLRTKDWAKFASLYNGKGYKANRYDEKLASAYIRFSRDAE